MVKPLFEIPTETLVKGPVGFIFAEDLTGLSSSIRHHARLGFKNLFVLKRQDLELPESCVGLCQAIDIPDAFFSDVSPYVNQIIELFPDRWIYYCFTGLCSSHPRLLDIAFTPCQLKQSHTTSSRHGHQLHSPVVLMPSICIFRFVKAVPSMI